jgi:hypothetical protein
MDAVGGVDRAAVSDVVPAGPIPGGVEVRRLMRNAVDQQNLHRGTLLADPGGQVREVRIVTVPHEQHTRSFGGGATGRVGIEPAADDQSVVPGHRRRGVGTAPASAFAFEETLHG